MATYGGPAQEILVASTDRPDLLGSFTIRLRSSTRPSGPTLLKPLSGPRTTATDWTLTARTYARDVFCMADKVDPAASIDGGMATLLPGSRSSGISPRLLWTFLSPFCPQGPADSQRFAVPDVVSILSRGRRKGIPSGSYFGRSGRCLSEQHLSIFPLAAELTALIHVSCVSIPFVVIVR